MKCLDIKFFRDLKISMSKLDPTSCMTEHIRSSPMPVSTHLTGNEESLPFESLLNSIKTKFQISMYLSPVSPSPGAFPSKFFPLSKNISEHGPHGPVSPIDQKLSSSPSFASLVEETPIFLSQISSDSLSSLWTVTQRRSSGSLSSSVKNSHAYSMAFSLKYSPKLKFPSISKKV